VDIEEASAVLDGRFRLVNPEHRCPKCKTPLQFKHNAVRSKLETIKNMDEYLGSLSWWKKLFIDEEYLQHTMCVDSNTQHWECPKCFEEFVVEVG